MNGKPVIFRPAARDELDEAFRWYEEREPGLGAAFLEAVERSLTGIAASSGHYPIIHRTLRRALLGRFPYGVYFLEEEERIVVIGVLHAARDPRTWRRRT